jgi:hypothetical protein
MGIATGQVNLPQSTSAVERNYVSTVTQHGGGNHPCRSIGRGADGVVCEVGVLLGRLEIPMPKDGAQHGQGQATGDTETRIGVPQIMDANTRKIGGQL